jgi:hypothetical protein
VKTIKPPTTSLEHQLGASILATIIGVVVILLGLVIPYIWLFGVGMIVAMWTNYFDFRLWWFKRNESPD